MNASLPLSIIELEKQLAELNKAIYNAKCESVNQPVYAPLNLNGNPVIVTDYKHNESKLIISEQAHIDFLLSGKRVTVIKPKRNKALSKRYFGI